MGDKTVLIFSAHADDTEFLAGGTVAKFVSEGFEVIEVIATDNGRGSMELDSETLVIQSRDKEAREAAKILGKKEVIFLGHPDGFLADIPLNVLREKFMRIIRIYRPRIMMTWDPWAPFETHPDHRHVAFAAMEALEFGYMPLFHPEHLKEGLKPHLIAERFYFAKHAERANKIVDITHFIDKKIHALLVQESQMKLTIDSAKLALSTVEADSDIMNFLDRENYELAIQTYVRAFAQKVGLKAGYEYGEEFRYETAADFFTSIQE